MSVHFMTEPFISTGYVYKKYDPLNQGPGRLVACPCPRCMNTNYRDRVLSAIRNMPPVGYKDLWNLMMRPLLVGFSEFNPVMFPIAWVQDGTPEHVPINPMRRVFHHMCKCLEMHRAIEGDEVEDVVLSIQGWGEELISWLLRRRRRGGEDGVRERLQLSRLAASLHELVGIDVVYKRVYFQLSALMRHAQISTTPKKLCAYAFSIGRANHMLEIARIFLGWYSGMQYRSFRACVGRIRRFLHMLMWFIVNQQRDEQSRRLAVAMALQCRLGLSAPIGVLGPDILPLCVPQTAMASILTWRDVLGKWIGEDCTMS